MNDINQNAPFADNDNKKPRKPRKLKNTKSPIPLQPISPQETKMLESLTKEINESINNVIKDELNNKKKKNLNLDQVKNILTEFLNTYLLLGYTIEGEPFLISQAKTPQEYNSLVEHLRLTFMNTFKLPPF